MKIKVREITKGCKFEFIDKGEWIDLRAAEDVELNAPQAGTQYEVNGNKYRDVSFDSKLIPLGIAMALPKGYEAVMAPRSSSYGKLGIMQANHLGIFDQSFAGNGDQWLLNAVAFRKTFIKKGDRICQFRIQLSQKATFWQKLKWLFTSKIEFEWVDNLEGPDRGGFGTTNLS